MRRLLTFFSAVLILCIAAYFSITFTACQHPVSPNPNPPVTGTTIQGHVYDVNGFPFWGVKVYSSPTNYTTTLRDGYFSLSNVTYPVTLIVKKDGDSTINVYQNLNANNPNLTYNSFSENTNFNEGAFLVHYPTVQPGKYMLIQFASEDIISFSYTFNVGDSVSARVPIKWQGDKSTIYGKLILMTYKRDPFSPFLISSYDAYAERSFYIDTNRIINTTFLGTDFTANPDEAIVNVKNYNFSTTSDNRISFSLAGNTNSDMFLDNYNFRGSFDFVVPKIFANNRMHITTNAPYNSDSYIENNAFTPENSIITFNGIPEIGMITPALNATDVDSTSTFFVKGNTNTTGIYCYQFQPVGNFIYSVWIYSASDTFKYPDLSGYGFNLKKGTEYKWFVKKYAPFYNLDDYLAYPTNKQIRNYDVQTNASYFITKPDTSSGGRPSIKLSK